MKTYKKKLYLFFFYLLIILSIHATFVAYVNPKGTFSIINNNFSTFTNNLFYKKIQVLQQTTNIDAAVVGSSTSEAFHPADIKSIFSKKTFLTSTAGAKTSSRFLMIKNLIEKHPKLNTIFYISDFFEFNNPFSNPNIYFLHKSSNYTSFIPKSLKLSYFDYFKHIFSNEMIESSFDVFKKWKKKNPIHVNIDGTTDRSLILSPIKNSNGFFSKLSKKEKSALNEYIQENVQTYSRSVLNDFEYLNKDVINLYQQIIKLTAKNNIKLFIIASPYHIDLKNEVYKKLNLESTYKKWQIFIDSLDNKKNVFTFTRFLNSFISNNSMSGVWRDGIHYNRTSASHILKEIKKTFILQKNLIEK